jgi:hypothetical protein
VLDEGGGHVGEHRLAVAAVATETPAHLSVTHFSESFVSLWLLRGGSAASPRLVVNGA